MRRSVSSKAERALRAMDADGANQVFGDQALRADQFKHAGQLAVVRPFGAQHLLRAHQLIAQHHDGEAFLPAARIPLVALMIVLRVGGTGLQIEVGCPNGQARIFRDGRANLCGL